MFDNEFKIIRRRSDEAIGLATYSNSDVTVSSYISIFENLWIQTELHKRRRQEEAATIYGKPLLPGTM